MCSLREKNPLESILSPREHSLSGEGGHRRRYPRSRRRRLSMESIGIHWNPLESIEIHWNPLESIGIHWNPLESIGIQWNPLGFHWHPLASTHWDSIGIHWHPLASIRIHSNPFESIGIHWNPLESIGIHSNPLQSIAIHWISPMDSNGFQCPSPSLCFSFSVYVSDS